MFTQRHFEAIATVMSTEMAIANERWPNKETSREQVRYVAMHLGDMFAQHNERFNRERYYAACGLNKDGSLIDGGSK